MTVGSLFSGIGGLELGLEMCGVGPVLWQAECDPYARAVLEHHWPTVRRYNDVREINGTAARVDLVCGGFPCQPHSVAGKRRGTSDARWLWPEFARIIEAVRPSLVFIENVPGLRSSGLRDVLADLARLGFDAEWGCFTAAHAGAPHRRKRLFVLAHANGDEGGIPAGRWSGSGSAATVWDAGTCPPWVAADANRARELQPGGSVKQQWRWACDGDRWHPEPPVPGVDDGTDGRSHRERLLGNAVVPQQAALAFRTLAARIAASPAGTGVTTP